MLTALLVCLAVGVVFVGGGFALGVAYERERHPSHSYSTRCHVRLLREDSWR